MRKQVEICVPCPKIYSMIFEVVRQVGLSDKWVVGQVGCQTSGMSDKWDVRQVGCQTSGMSDKWDVRQVGLSDKWDCQTSGMSDKWDVGQVGCWTSGLFDIDLQGGVSKSLIYFCTSMSSIVFSLFPICVL